MCSQVEQYRSTWDQIRRNGGFSQPEEEVHLLDSSDSDKEDAMENISLADRLKLRAATEVLERQRQSRLAAGGQEEADSETSPHVSLKLRAYHRLGCTVPSHKQSSDPVNFPNFHSCTLQSPRGTHAQELTVSIFLHIAYCFLD